MSNAIKFTKKGSIRIKAKQQGKNVFIDVTDTGIGIKAEDVSKLFTEYYMVNDDNHKRLNPNGSGLGLYLSKSLAVLMKGDITVESTYNKGTKFTIRLPVESNNMNEENKIQTILGEYTEPSLVSFDTKGGSAMITVDCNKRSGSMNLEDSRVACFKRKKAVLIVDDDFCCTLMLSKKLQKLSLDVDKANNGPKAIEMVEARIEDPYALIIMDINMPEMSGLEVMVVNEE